MANATNTSDTPRPTLKGNPFCNDADLNQAALLLADIQNQIASRFSPSQLDNFKTQTLAVLTLFRDEMDHRASSKESKDELASHDLPDGCKDVPLFLQRAFPRRKKQKHIQKGVRKIVDVIQKKPKVGAFLAFFIQLFLVFLQPLLAGVEGEQVSSPVVRSISTGIEPALQHPDQQHDTQSDCRKARSRISLVFRAARALRTKGAQEVTILGTERAGVVPASVEASHDTKSYHVVSEKAYLTDEDDRIDGTDTDSVLPRYVENADVVVTREGK